MGTESQIQLYEMKRHGFAFKEMVASDGKKNENKARGHDVWLHILGRSDSARSTVMAEAWEGVGACGCDFSAMTV